jgi:uncharacterized protein YcnI
MHPKLLVPLALLAAAAAQAHVGLASPSAPAGSSFKATFQVGHGCGPSATRQVGVTLPVGVIEARPMPKPGWSLEIQREKLAQPVARDGRTIAERVARITWTARTAGDALPSDQYDEFVLMAQLPNVRGALAWPVAQVCDTGRIDWAEVPRPGQLPRDIKNPAPVLELLPASRSGHKH